MLVELSGNKEWAMKNYTLKSRYSVLEPIAELGLGFPVYFPFSRPRYNESYCVKTDGWKTETVRYVQTTLRRRGTGKYLRDAKVANFKSSIASKNFKLWFIYRIPRGKWLLNWEWGLFFQNMSCLRGLTLLYLLCQLKRSVATKIA